MSIKGNADTNVLRGKVTGTEVICLDAYYIAVKNGFEGTEKEWLASLKGEQGEKGKDGVNGVDGKDYVLTEANKEEIADIVQKMFVDVSEVGR